MNLKVLAALVGLCAISAVSPAYADPDLDQLCTQFPQNSRCEGYVPTVTDGDYSRDPETGFAVLNTGDWRTSDNIPYSQPVMVNDPFDGNYLAVIDKNFSGNVFWVGSEAGIITNWSQRYIRVYAYTIEQKCNFWTCSNEKVVQETDSFEVKIGEEAFRLEGEDGNFEVTPELATALSNAPAGVTLTRLSFENSGEVLLNEIGAETTEAWRTVYQAP